MNATTLLIVFFFGVIFGFFGGTYATYELYQREKEELHDECLDFCSFNPKPERSNAKARN